MAVGVVIGAAFGDVVTAFTTDLLTPLIAAIVGKPETSPPCSFTVGETRHSMLGDFINATIVVSAGGCCRLLLRGDPVNALVARMRKDPAADPTTKKCPECLERDSHRRRALCAHLHKVRLSRQRRRRPSLLSPISHSSFHADALSAHSVFLLSARLRLAPILRTQSSTGSSTSESRHTPNYAPEARLAVREGVYRNRTSVSLTRFRYGWVDRTEPDAGREASLANRSFCWRPLSILRKPPGTPSIPQRSSCGGERRLLSQVENCGATISVRSTEAHQSERV